MDITVPGLTVDYHVMNSVKRGDADTTRTVPWKENLFQ